MKLEPDQLLLLQSLIPKHRGVFSTYDLANLLSANSSVALSRKLKPFLKAGLLHPFCRGYYVADNFSLEWLSQRLSPGSALSFGTVLAKKGLIGNIPQKTVYAIKIGKTRIYQSRLGNIVHFGYASPAAGRRHWFGYADWEGGILSADTEKAFLDTLYFYQSGNKFSFNIYSDIAVEKLDSRKIENYLKKYKNPKFIVFVKGVLHGYHSV
ncbi:MAG: hypothetical protein HYT76_04215 [Deltaproteobacteria bacterium]|nr:hypothetical protein [Deltaproteobacteria bacterium]